MSETLLQVENLRTYFHTFRGVVKAVDGISFSRWNKTFWTKSNQVISVVSKKCFFYKIVILRLLVLDKCSLHLFFMMGYRCIYLFHCSWVITCIIHTC